MSKIIRKCDEERCPPGHNPLWMKCTDDEITRVSALTQVKEVLGREGLSGPGVTVIDWNEKEKAAVEEFCREQEWVYGEFDIFGSEADVSSLTVIVVVLSIHTLLFCRW